MRKEKEMNALLQDNNADAILVCDGYGMRYLSGFSGMTGFFYYSRKRAVVLTDFRYIFQAREQVYEGVEVKEVAGSYAKTIHHLCKEDMVNRILFEDQDVTYTQWKTFSQEADAVEFVPIGEEIKNLRAIKEDTEKEKIKKAEAIGDLAFSHILQVIKPGITEIEVAAELEYVMKKNGAEGLSFDTIVASGIHSSMPHAGVTNKKITLGDFVTMDFGCIYEGYCSDMTRTIAVGNVSEKQKKVYNTVLQAQKLALEAIHGNVSGKEIDSVAREYINQAGYEGCFGHGLGHSVGLFIHENPRFSQGEKGIVKAGNVITVEPGIYLENEFGVRIEDVVEVTTSGYVNYTSSNKELIVL